MLLFNYCRHSVVLMFCIALIGCQVRPLYQNSRGFAAPVSIEVAEVNTRYAQEVRNHILFLITGGAAEVKNPEFVLDLGISEQVSSTANMAFNLDEEIQPSAGRMTLTSVYTLKNSVSGKVVTTGKRSLTASFDRNVQQFSNLRAERDASNRAARELAALVYGDVTVALSR
jgi:LPS-assembly lipoprotein